MVEGASTDDSGMILLANHYSDVGLSFINVSLIGSVEETVEIMINRNMVTIADVPYY